MRFVVLQGEVNNTQRDTWKLSVYSRNLKGTIDSKLKREGNKARKDNEKVVG